MAGTHTDTQADEEGDDVSQILPEHSVLTLDEYLDMQQAVGNKHRFRILHTLKEQGPLSATELETALDMASNKLHYHLDTLVDVGLVENRKRKTANRSGLYSYYRASAMGTAILEHGVEELMRREWEALDRYGT